MKTGQRIVIDPDTPGGMKSPYGLILFDGVCILCSAGCGFVSKRDRRHYFRFIAIQSPEGRPLAEQLGIDPDHPDSFVFVAKGQAFVKSEAALRIARELPRWQWTWVWPAPGSEDTELGVLMELEVGHGETEVHPGIQA